MNSLNKPKTNFNGSGSMKKPGGMASKKALRIATEEKAMIERREKDSREQSLFGERIFTTLSYDIVFELAQACTPALTSSEIASCFGLNPQGSSMKTFKSLWKSKKASEVNTLPRSWVVNLVEASFKAERLNETQYVYFKEKVVPKKAILIPNRRQVAYMIGKLKISKKFSA